ncbi:FMN-linked oxidoreductase [Gautieria morchelliformis]|nr:FMN-linked oxidoreductase [Gautieria morchelliformis]
MVYGSEDNSLIINRPAPNVSYFTPAQSPPSGKASEGSEDAQLPKLFTPLQIRGLQFQNRIFLSPMCQYSCQDGHLTDWHMAHLGGILSRGPGLTIIEATAVTANGRITPEDSGLWKDSQIEPLKRIVDFAHSQSQKICIQLAHAGRKASTVAPWLHTGATASPLANGWPDDVALTKEGIKEIVAAFVHAAQRAMRAGIDLIEIHNAHGYLLFSFCSPASNKRTDEYGGSFENRIRFTLEVVDAIRATIPSDMPLLLRISATDWLEESLPDTPSWRLGDTVKLAKILSTRGVDFLDVSSGGNHPKQKVRGGPAYQAPFAAAVKEQLGDKLLVGSVGSIKDGKLAESLLQNGMTDVTLVGRQFQRRPGLVWDWADELGVKIKVANQIEWGFGGKGTSRKARPKL